MGSYLSEPVTEKVSSDDNNDKLICGASSMQGWRLTQEVTEETFKIISYTFDILIFLSSILGCS